MWTSTTRQAADRGGFAHELAVRENEYSKLYDRLHRAAREMHRVGAFKGAVNGAALLVIDTRLTIIISTRLNAEISRGLVDASILVAAQVQRDAQIDKMLHVPTVRVARQSA